MGCLPSPARLPMEVCSRPSLAQIEHALLQQVHVALRLGLVQFALLLRALMLARDFLEM